MRKNRLLLENLLCVLALGLLPAFAFFPAVFHRAAPLALQSIFFFPPWEEARPAGLEEHPDALRDLQAQRYYPDYKFISESFHAKQSLLWNPREGLGTPFAAEWRTRVFSPFTLPVYFLPLPLAIRVSVLLKMLVAGLCAYFAGRRFGFAPSIALLAGVAYELGAPVYVWSGFPLSDVMPWLPLLVLCAERHALGRVAAWPATALVLTVMLLGGDPETGLTLFVFAGLYAFFRRYRREAAGKSGAAAAGLAIAALAAILAISVQFLPYLEFVRQSVPAGTAVAHGWHLSDLLALLWPKGIAYDHADGAAIIYLLHVGVVQLLLLALWLAVRDYAEDALRARVEALLLASGALMAIGIALAPWLPALAGIESLGVQHFFLPLGLSFALMAAAAAEQWVALDAEQCKNALLRLFVTVPAVWGGLLALSLFAGLRSPVPTGMLALGLGAAVVIAAVIAALLGITLLRPNLRVMGYGLAALTLISLWWNLHDAIPYTPDNEIFPQTAFVKSLQNVNARVGGSDTLQEWPLGGNDVATVFSMGGLRLRRYDKFLQRMKEEPLLLRRTSAEALLLTKEDIRGNFAGIRPVLNIQEVYPSGAVLFKDMEALPRARMLYGGRPVERFRAEELHADQPPLIERIMVPEQSPGPVSQASIVAPEAHDQVTVQVAKTRPGVLVLADAWYPDWRAAVDGVPSDMFPVDGIFRGVVVGEGAHEVDFKYMPSSFKWGCAMSLIGGLVIACGLAWLGYMTFATRQLRERI